MHGYLNISVFGVRTLTVKKSCSELWVYIFGLLHRNLKEALVMRLDNLLKPRLVWPNV
nr:putative integron gene cassette protein [uncultured bacterium]